MERRGLLRALAALAAGATAGCVGTDSDVPETAPNGPVGVRETPTPTERPDRTENGSAASPARTTDGGTPTATPYPLFEVADFDAAQAENGNLLVEVTVENTSDRHHVQSLVISFEAGEDAYRERRFVSLPVDSSVTIHHRFPVAYDEFPGGKLSFDVERETPATPITVRTGEVTLTPD